MHIYSDPASERHVNTAAGIETPQRFPAALAGAEAAEESGVPVEWRSCEPAPREALAAVHAPTYLDRIRGISEAGGGYLDLDTGLNAYSWDAATLASGAAIGAVESALEEGTPAFVIARPPGHHAGRSYGMGFCLINHAAVAAEYARARGVDRVAIVDWDVHHGNGTQDIFYAHGGVLYLSAHQSPFYPGTGAVREVGEGQGEGFTANVLLPARSGEDDYAAALAGFFVPILREYRPGLIIVSAGYDAHADDLLGGMRLTAGSYGRFAATLAAVAREVGAVPPMFILEGGYNLSALTASVAATVEGAAGEPEGEPPALPEYRGGVRPVEAARKALAPYWESLR